MLSLIPWEMFSHLECPGQAPERSRSNKVAPENRWRSTWVLVTFESVSARITRVRVRHMGFAELAAEAPDQTGELQQARAYLASAWPRMLQALRGHFAKPEPARRE